MRRRTLAALLAALLTGGAPAAAGDPARGQALYQQCYFACHAEDAHRVGPAHRGVFGRRAGSAPGYAYSPALAASSVVWSAASLERWLADPEGLVPGQRIYYAVANARDRADLIAYLRSLSTP